MALSIGSFFNLERLPLFSNPGQEPKGGRVMGSVRRSFAELGASARYAEAIANLPQGIKPPEWLCVVSKSEQKNYVFHHGHLWKTYAVTTGSRDMYPGNRELPKGHVLIVNNKMEMPQDPQAAESLYGSRFMALHEYNPLTRSFDIYRGLALHGYRGPLEKNFGLNPVSMGCVYHSNKDIEELYARLPIGSLVIISA